MRTAILSAAKTKPDVAALFVGRKAALDDEWGRILALPRLEAMDPLLVDFLHKNKGKAQLREVQARALAMILKYRGLFAPIGVGHGKSLVAWLAPVVLGNARTVIMMPPPMVEPFKKEIDKFKHFFIVPNPVPEIVPYSILSSASGTDLLKRLNPQVIIADEGHALMHADSARTKRLMRFFSENPNTIFITLSGTFFAKKPSQLAHLVQFSLDGNAFMPVRGRALEIWANCVDLDGRPNESDWDAFAPLAVAEGINLKPFAGDKRLELARKSVYSRLRATPGVVTTIEMSFEAPLNIVTHDHNEIAVPPEVEAALVKVLTEEETPDGDDIIVDDAQKARIQNYLSAGFFYRWAWEKVGGKDAEWIMARKVWHKALRKELEKRSKEGYDSPLLIANTLDRQLLIDPTLAHKKPLHGAYDMWLEQRHKPVPPTEAVWVSDFFVRWLVDFVSDGVPTVIWYSSRAMGEALAAAGFDVYGVGTEVPEFSGQTVCASIQVHGEGKNGWQPWWRALLAEPPVNSKKYEQLLGRQHRPGQKHGFVEVHVPVHTAKLRKALDSAVRGAYHTKELSGVDQRLLLANFKNKD